MKSAEEWHKEFFGRILNSEEEWLEILRVVQRDALRAAAEKCLEIADYAQSGTLPFPLPGVNAAMGCRSQILALIPEEKQK